MIQTAKIKFLILISLIIFLALLGRLFYLQIYLHSDFRQKALDKNLHTIELAAKRGNITDRNGTLLASTVDSYTAYVYRPQVRDIAETARQLASVLSLSVNDVSARISNPNYIFVLIKRQLSDAEAEKLRALKIPGVNLISEQKRVYLRGNLAANVLGYVDQENKGLGGIEGSMERYLQGIPGQLIVERDPFGREIHVGNRYLKEPQNGDHVTLTIDEFLQYIAHKYLAQTVKEERADGGSVIIMDSQNGQILAMVSLPDYDPNRYSEYPIINQRNNNISTVYDPGSVFKLITVAAGLDLGLVSENTPIVNGNYFQHAGATIRESHILPDPEKIRSVKDIIIESLNISAAKLALQIGKINMYAYLDKFRLRRKTGIQLAGESAGLIKAIEQVTPLDEAVYGYGHSLSVTPLQMLCAVNAIANDGIYVEPGIILRLHNNKHGLLKDYSQDIRRHPVIQAQTAQKLRLMMQECVQFGSGTAARLPGYSIGGKTGTSQKNDGRTQLAGQYISSFAGIVPGNRPRLTILVTVDNPKKSYYGAVVAAPIFREIAREAVRYLAIPEDI